MSLTPYRAVASLPAPAALGLTGRAPRDGELLDRVRARLVARGEPATPAAVAAALRVEGSVLGDEVVLEVAARLRGELAGLGPLEPLVRDPSVTDVLVNGPDEVWVDRGQDLERAGVRFADDAAVRRLAQRLAAAAGRRLDDASPWVDARLPDGIRLHAVLHPVAAEATCLSLRVPRRRGFRLDELVAARSLPAEAADCLRQMIEARVAFLVAGGTGTGKTTLLATLLESVPPTERVLLVEDSGELRPRHPHVVRLEARPPNLEGAGQVTLRDLVRQALRMRPDRLVVGEVRGAEVVDLLAALNTGHEGGCGTVHANAATDVPARLEALAVAAGMDRAALHSQLAAGLHAVIHLLRRRDGQRRLASVSVLERSASGLVGAVTALTIEPDGSLRAGPGEARLRGLIASGSAG